MRRPKNTPTYKAIVNAAARAAFVSAWADYQEERGRSLRGELMDQAPKTPGAAKKWAVKLIRQMENDNGVTIERMYEHASRDGGSASDFGHYTAMQALGHGVAWSDDHEPHGYTIPYAEFHMDGSRSFYASVSDRPGIGSRG